VRQRQKEDLMMEPWSTFEDESLMKLAEHHLHNFTLVALMLNMRPATVGRKRSPRQCQERYQLLHRKKVDIAQAAQAQAQAAAAAAQANMDDIVAQQQAQRLEAAARAAKASLRGAHASASSASYFGTLRPAREGLLHAPWPSHRQEEGITPSVLPVTQVKDMEYNARRGNFLTLIKCERNGKRDVPTIPGTDGDALEGEHPSHHATLLDRRVPPNQILTPLQIMGAALQQQQQQQHNQAALRAAAAAVPPTSVGDIASSSSAVTEPRAHAGAGGVAARPEGVASAPPSGSTSLPLPETVRLPIAGQQSLPPALMTANATSSSSGHAAVTPGGSIQSSSSSDIPAMSPFSQVAASASMQQAQIERQQALAMTATAISPSAMRPAGAAASMPTTMNQGANRPLPPPLSTAASSSSSSSSSNATSGTLVAGSGTSPSRCGSASHRRRSSACRSGRANGRASKPHGNGSSCCCGKGCSNNCSCCSDDAWCDCR
jgi:hypothetical protein